MPHNSTHDIMCLNQSTQGGFYNGKKFFIKSF
nr:MAG TPA: hypothetical protein [Bacteriophage sp.]